jgi:diguanylate cyclase (GGDEF)-like protein
VLLAHAGFTVLFAALYHALLGVRLSLARRAEQQAVRLRVAQAEERARELRLVTTAAPEESAGGESARERQLLAAVAELEEALQGALSVGAAALRPHAIALFLASPDGESLRLRECVSESDRLLRDPLPAREGVLGAVLRAGQPLRLAGEGPPLGYYQGSAEVCCFLGVPLWQRPATASAEAVTQPPGELPQAEPLGVLVADREQPFTPEDEQLLVRLARELVRSIEAERLLSAVRREKEEKARFFRALEALNRTRTAPEAAQVALEHARRLCPSLDLCAVTLCEEAPPALRRARSAAGAPRLSRPPLRLRHRVLGAAGEGTGALEGLLFADNQGLVASVVRLGAPLPGRPLGAMERPVIFDGATAVRGLAALKILPLRAGEETVGTLVCGSRDRAGLPAAAQGELALLAMQVAQALVRARLFETAERLATTDGLTGLLNRRSLDEQLRARFAEASRYGRSLAFVLIDVDHFKKVNDTHGHPAGDAVLRGVAAVVAAQARETDRAARYGGEEMALLLPETDLAGALVIAERLRAAVEQSSHQTGSAELRVTVSVGVSALVAGGPSAAGPEQLLEAADQALYRAKQGGRNRVEAGRGSGVSAA